MPVIDELKSAYKLWHQYHELVPKSQKYSLGNRIDKLFVEAIEASVTAMFLSKEEKLPWIRLTTRKTDTAKVLLMILWETGSIDDKKYLALSSVIDDAGKMLGGWYGQTRKHLEEKRNPALSKEKAGK